MAFKSFVAKTGWSPDDWAILATTLSGVPNTVFGVHGTVANGLGRDVWTLEPDQITKFGMFFYMVEVFYFVTVALLKASILLFYLRIFPNTGTRRTLWATLILNNLFGVAFVLAAIFQCTPISHYWTKWDGTSKGTCININGLGWANAIVSIVFDLWMLAIPLSQLPKLRLHWKRKIGVALMFSVGTLYVSSLSMHPRPRTNRKCLSSITIVSIIRLQSLLSFANSQNPTWDNAAVSNWSFVEMNVGIICACMPTARLALMRGFKVFRETTIRGGYTYGYNIQTSNSAAGPQSRAAATSSGPVVSADAPSNGAIAYQKTFTVQYSSDHDEASLVHMRDLGGRDGRDGRDRMDGGESRGTASVSSV